MKTDEVSYCVLKQAKGIMETFTQEQWDALGERVQCNVDREDFPQDIEEAENSAPEGASLFQIKDDSFTIWLFTVKDESEIIDILEDIKDKY